MKLKVDFVTNSSSASFVILKERLSGCQIDLLHDHLEIGLLIAKHEGIELYVGGRWGKRGAWNITESETTIEGWTSMDNFDMLWYFKKIGIRREDVDYDHS